MVITIDPTQLNPAQRKHVAAFIADFPCIAVIEEEEDADNVASVAGVTAYLDEDEQEEQTPETAFAAASPQTEATTDAKGMPWDERIHSSSRATNADGSWRLKRGVDKDLVAKVEGELRQLPSNVVAMPAAVVPPPPPAPVITEAVTPPPPAPVVDATTAFVNLVTKASKAITDGKLTQDQLNAAAVTAGLANFHALGKSLELLPQVERTIDTFIAAAS